MRYYAKQRQDGTLSDGGFREAPEAGDVEIAGPWGPSPRGVTLCGVDCALDHSQGRHAVPVPPPVPTYAELRAAEYDRRGATADAMIVALWERIVEGRPAASDAIQAARAAVKAAYPKPGA